MYKEIIEKELKLNHNASPIAIIQALLCLAYEHKATDIHIFPKEKELVVRFRIDGILQDMFTMPASLHQLVITRMKILTGLRTDEHYIPQDGRFHHRIDENCSIDVRISILPTYYGENAELRLLRNQSDDFSLHTLGFNTVDEKTIQASLQRSHGMIIVTGPTGSGKTTTLYSCIKLINVPAISVITIEDPIEYAINGITQTQVNIKNGLTFENGLRSILRQDPNVIMVGEIRDKETASIAINAALTGHLVLTTLHTYNALMTLPRLIDIGIEPYLIASTITMSISQRLIRKICKACMSEVKLQSHDIRGLNEIFPHAFRKGSRVYKGSGCKECNGSGYSGRTIISEVVRINKNLQEAITRRSTAAELKDIVQQQGMKSLLDDGLDKVRQGVTTTDELIRTLYE